MSRKRPKPQAANDPKQAKTFGGTVKDSLLEFQPGAKPWGDYFGEKFPNMKLRKWVVLSLIWLVIATVAVWGVHWADRNHAEMELTATNITVETLKQKVQDLGREKGEIQEERDTAQIKAQNAENALAPWKELANSKFPNSSINDRLDLLFQRIASMESATPKFDVQLNGLEITNGMLVSLPPTGQMNFIVMNTGDDTATGLTLLLALPIASTNATFFGSWTTAPVNAYSANRQRLTGVTTWMDICENRIAAGDVFELAPFTILTNFPKAQISKEVMAEFTFTPDAGNTQIGSYYLPAYIIVYSDNSKRQRMNVLLCCWGQ